MLVSSARSFPASCSQCGSGIVDAAAAVAAASGGGGGGGGGGGDTVLENGVSETDLAASSGAELRYTMDVPAGATGLSFAMSGGAGDADLYVRFGSAPTTSAYDCRPYLGGNAETCAIDPAQSGTYHVMVRAYSTFSGVNLVGNYTEDTGGGGGGTASCPAGYETYTGTLSAGATDYQPNGSYYYASSRGRHHGILMGPDGADFDLYIDKERRGSWRQKASSTSSSSDEEISYTSGRGNYTWRVVSYSGAGDYTLCLDYP
jgi:serine protease